MYQYKSRSLLIEWTWDELSLARLSSDNRASRSKQGARSRLALFELDLLVSPGDWQPRCHS